VPVYIAAAYEVWLAILLTAAGVIPGMALYFFYIYHIVEESVQVTSVEHFRHRSAVEVVRRCQKEDRSVMLLRVMVALHDHGDENEKSTLDEKSYKAMRTALKEIADHKDEEHEHHNSIATMLELDTTLELEAMAAKFDELDTDGSGYLTKEEIAELLKQSQGMQVDVSSHAFMASALNTRDPTDKDNNKHPDQVSKAQFLTFMVDKSKKAMDLSAEHITEWCFKQWDQQNGEDPSSKLSVEELQKGLSGLGDSFSANEVSALVVQLDVNNDGEFDREEMEHWVELHTRARPTGVFQCSIFGF